MPGLNGRTGYDSAFRIGYGAGNSAAISLAKCKWAQQTEQDCKRLRTHRRTSKLDSPASGSPVPVDTGVNLYPSQPADVKGEQGEWASWVIRAAARPWGRHARRDGPADSRQIEQPTPIAPRPLRMSGDPRPRLAGGSVGARGLAWRRQP